MIPQPIEVVTGDLSVLPEEIRNKKFGATLICIAQDSCDESTTFPCAIMWDESNNLLTIPLHFAKITKVLRTYPIKQGILARYIEPKFEADRP